MVNRRHQARTFPYSQVIPAKIALLVTLVAIPITALAAGLGKIVVFSDLGQPLRAEIEVHATKNELSDMTAKLGSPETFRQAGIDYPRTLSDARFNLEKKSNGRSLIKISTDRAINEPIVDMLIDLSWSSGRLIREFTFLLDPPRMAGKNPLPITAPTTYSPTSPENPKASNIGQRSIIDEETRGKALASITVNASGTLSDERSLHAKNVYTIRPGDNLQKIASATKPEDISLEQMLVALLRANPKAFDNGNMNRLNSGEHLAIPEKSVSSAIPQAEAARIVKAQSSDWNAYRATLAGQPAHDNALEEGAAQGSSGRITAKVEDKDPSTIPPKDIVKLSKTPTSRGKNGEQASINQEELIAKSKALDEANDRIASLEKNISDMQRLIELRNQALAELQQKIEPEGSNRGNGDSSPGSDIAPIKTASAQSLPPPSSSAPARQPAPPSANRPTAAQPGTSWLEELMDYKLVLGVLVLIIAVGGFIAFARRRNSIASHTESFA